MRATINQHIAYIATDLERGDPSFIRGYLETQYDYFRQVGAGGGSTKGALTCAFLRSVPIPLPPTLEEQREIVAILDAIDRKIDLHKRKLAVLDELFNALLHKLMIGEIRVADLDLSALASPKELEAAE
jgi:type I restriction enzyme S subunit